ncbi:uncharacterized protein [Anabrus simplex]|uniref:uncharacterized protein n=1 Tax=Anabrus simplex TaxID=316456 RepID=UPI0035A2C9E8
MFDTEVLIRAVQKRPVIYDTKCQDYSDKQTRVTAWIEICRELYHDWDGISNEARNKRGRDIQTRWKSLRDNFIRELKIQRKISSGQPVPKRRKYIYFDQLLFLKPSFDYRRNARYRRNLPESSFPLDNTISEAGDVQVEAASSSATVVDKSEHMNCTRTHQTNEDMLIDMLTTSVLQSEQREADDEMANKHFLLSLLPLMRKLNDEANVAARIQLLDVLRRALVNQHLTTLSNTE